MMSRRTLLLTAVPGGLATVGLAGGAAAMLLPPAPREPGSVRRVCRLGEMDVGGQITLVPDNVLVIRTHQGIYSISLVCTHLGCGVVKHEQGFRCHCHGSLFDGDGRPVQGPASRDLPWYSVLVREGWVLVDLDRPVSTGTMTPV